MPLFSTSLATVPWNLVPSSATITPPPSTAATPTTSDLHSLLRLCTHLRQAQQIHAVMLKTSRLSHTHSAACLAEFYALSPHGSLASASTLLSSFHGLPSTFMFNALIRGHLRHRHPHLSLLLFLQMLLRHVPPDPFTFTFALKASPDLPVGRQLHAQVLARDFASNPHVRNKLIHLYSRLGAVEDARKLLDAAEDVDVIAWNSLLEGYVDRGDGDAARKLFDEMPVRDIVSWNTLMAFHIEAGEYEEAIAMFVAMQENGVCVDQVSLISALSAIAQLGALGQGKWVHAYIMRNGIELGANLSSALINMYSKCGCVDGAVSLFEGMSDRSVDTWNAMITGFVANGMNRRALETFSWLEASCTRPNAISFSCVLNACSHGGFVDEGVQYFEKMTGVYGIDPDIAHYGCMVDLFCRAGMFEKAEEIMQEMPMDPDPVMLKAVLGGCRIHLNFELGEKAGMKFIELAPDDHAGYVLLSNLYAVAGRWEAVHKVRKMMWKRGIKKIPGCSAIESGGEIHEFIAGDSSHARKSEIYGMLGEMAEKLRQAGYEPDTRQVLLDIDEEEVKENSLNHHSEKLAIAFGLISTLPRTTIRVVKNLRVCSDCHDAIKLLSKIYERDIIVRDCNRFHHFQNGLCSCNDYW